MTGAAPGVFAGGWNSPVRSRLPSAWRQGRALRRRRTRRARAGESLDQEAGIGLKAWMVRAVAPTASLGARTTTAQAGAKPTVPITRTCCSSRTAGTGTRVVGPLDLVNDSASSAALFTAKLGGRSAT